MAYIRACGYCSSRDCCVAAFFPAKQSNPNLCLSPPPPTPVQPLQLGARNQILRCWCCAAQLPKGSQPGCPNLTCAQQAGGRRSLPPGVVPSLSQDSAHGGKGQVNVLLGISEGHSFWAGAGAFTREKAALDAVRQHGRTGACSPLWALPRGLHARVTATSEGRGGFVVTCESLQVSPATSNDTSELV